MAKMITSHIFPVSARQSVRLIKLRYPSLLENVIQRKAPHDLGAHFAIQQLKKQGAKEEEIGLFYVTPCIAKIASVKSPVGEKESIVDGILNMNSLYNRVMTVIEEKEVPSTKEQRKKPDKRWYSLESDPW